MIKYYNGAHQPPPRTVEIDGQQWPVQRLIDADDVETLELLGIYRHEWIDTSTIPGEWGDWQQIDDERGTKYVRYAVRRVTVEGDAPLGYTDWELRQDEQGRDYHYREPAGTEPERLDAAKKQKRFKLYQRRVKAEKSPFLHDGRRYDGGDDSIERFGVVAQQITWALMAGTPADTVVITGGWRDVDDIGGPSTIAEVQALLQSHYQHGVLCEQNSQTIKAAINVATTVAELDAIDLEQGWP